jgi:hypothetical protein
MIGSAELPRLRERARASSPLPVTPKAPDVSHDAGAGVGGGFVVGNLLGRIRSAVAGGAFAHSAVGRWASSGNFPERVTFRDAVRKGLEASPAFSSVQRWSSADNRPEHVVFKDSAPRRLLTSYKNASRLEPVPPVGTLAGSHVERYSERFTGRRVLGDVSSRGPVSSHPVDSVRFQRSLSISGPDRSNRNGQGAQQARVSIR